MQIEEDFEDNYDRLKQKRDELRVQLNLGKKEIRSAWEDFQNDWRQLERKMRKFRNDTAEAGEKFADEIREMMEGAEESLSKLRKRFG